MLDQIQSIADNYDDLKSRYVWALGDIADLTIALNRHMILKHKLEAETYSQERSLEKTAPFSVAGDEEKTSSKEQSRIYVRKNSSINVPIEKKQAQNIDELLGLTTLTSTQKLSNKSQKAKRSEQQSDFSIRTEVTESPWLTTIEDIPIADQNVSAKTK
ncbi:uncharacterized protein LOC129219704 [Uloborus diversus]|uniref:uncharacterized protein LOC129219704 n=1 Tax=Uloborus diversus TaxID=327109 RepID=UPI00240998F2|nr:uncharacterized protein LOC129219704 [Uloborus diversus]